ncbi:hypothetical protein [Oceanobacillus sp. J11TS1]|nr:hypothetical protein [Oceanobacillus sp. J11TS1]GIO25089.1 hypothetical protein J11TS1_36700 [Oceanobacillus sp. J11TS1]
MSEKVVSNDRNTLLDLDTGELEIKNASVNKDFPLVFVGKEAE